MRPADAFGADPRPASILSFVTVLVAAGMAVALALLSLRWPLVHDLPIFLYDGFLMKDRGLVPYRDFYEINAPGTLVFYAWVHEWTQGASVLLRLLDLGILSIISVVTILALRAHGVAAGVLAASCFAIVYLSRGPVHALQREYLAVLPLAVSLALVGRPRAWATDWRMMALTGLLAGTVVPVKPLLAICWAPLPLAALIVRMRGAATLTPASVVREGAAVALPFAAGLAVVPALTIVWLWRQDALGAYLEIARNYYPLYAELKGNGMMWQGTALEAVQRYVTNPLELIQSFPFAVLAFLGVAAAWSYRGRLTFDQCLLFATLALCSIVYVAVTGKFWAYHRFPLFYALALLAGLSVSREVVRGANRSVWWNVIVLVALLVGMPFELAGRELTAWSGKRPIEVKEGRVDMVVDYLAHQVPRSATVMPLDVTSGVVHALYRDRRPMYGRFVYDVHFYHHARHPYVQRLRNDLLGEFTADGPDFVIRADDTWLRTPDFPELDAVLARDYELAHAANQVSIYRRRHP